MDFEEFKHKLATGFEQPLPGIEAQHLMAPAGRTPSDISAENRENARKAAVLALFFPKGSEARLILTLRKEYKGVHSNQVSFPGGRREEEDLSFEQTALRETEEEIGLPQSLISVHGKLSPIYIPPSNFLVHPFVGTYESIPQFQRQEAEVQEIFTVSVRDLIDDQFLGSMPLKLGQLNYKVPAFDFNGYKVWGATAMMLSELRQMLRGSN